MSKLILAVNAGSSSLKFQLIKMPEEKLVTKGVIERIGLSDSIFTIHVNGEKLTDIRDIHNHEEAVNIMLDSFKEHEILKTSLIFKEQVIVLYTVVKLSLNQLLLLMK